MVVATAPTTLEVLPTLLKEKTWCKNADLNRAISVDAKEHIVNLISLLYLYSFMLSKPSIAKSVLFLGMGFVLLSSSCSRLFVQSIYLSNTIDEVVYLETFPYLRWSGLQEKYIRMEADSTSNDTTWIWDFYDMQLQILNYPQIREVRWKENIASIHGEYMVHPKSIIRLGINIESPKSFVGATSTDLIVDSMVLKTSAGIKTLNREEIWSEIQSQKPIRKKDKAKNNSILTLDLSKIVFD